MELKTEAATKIQRYWRNKCKLKDTGYSSDTDTDMDSISLKVLSGDNLSSSKLNGRKKRVMFDNYDTESARHLNTEINWEIETDSDTDSDSDTVTDTDTEIDSETDSEIDSEIDLETNLETDLETDSEMDTNHVHYFVKSIWYLLPLLPLLIVIFNYYA